MQTKHAPRGLLPALCLRTKMSTCQRSKEWVTPIYYTPLLLKVQPRPPGSLSSPPDLAVSQSNYPVWDNFEYLYHCSTNSYTKLPVSKSCLYSEWNQKNLPARLNKSIQYPLKHTSKKQSIQDKIHVQACLSLLVYCLS